MISNFQEILREEAPLGRRHYSVTCSTCTCTKLWFTCTCGDVVGQKNFPSPVGKPVHVNTMNISCTVNESDLFKKEIRVKLIVSSFTFVSWSAYLKELLPIHCIGLRLPVNFFAFFPCMLWSDWLARVSVLTFFL